jgi:diguanylate cyclase (GGDEF)-like protein
MTTGMRISIQKEHQQRAGDRLEPQVAAAIAQAQEQGNSLSLIVLDVDEFRQINEVYGHDVGDQVLAKLSTIVEKQAGLPVVRWGGEEFAVLCPGHNLKEAEALAERIRSAVANHSFSGAGMVTISLGVAIHQTGNAATDVVQRAIAATYQAKRAGKNRVIVG